MSYTSSNDLKSPSLKQIPMKSSNCLQSPSTDISHQERYKAPCLFHLSLSRPSGRISTAAPGRRRPSAGPHTSLFCSWPSSTSWRPAGSRKTGSLPTRIWWTPSCSTGTPFCRTTRAPASTCRSSTCRRTDSGRCTRRLTENSHQPRRPPGKTCGTATPSPPWTSTPSTC